MNHEGKNESDDLQNHTEAVHDKPFLRAHGEADALALLSDGQSLLPDSD